MDEIWPMSIKQFTLLLFFCVVILTGSLISITYTSNYLMIFKLISLSLLFFSFRWMDFHFGDTQITDTSSCQRTQTFWTLNDSFGFLFSLFWSISLLNRTQMHSTTQHIPYSNETANTIATIAMDMNSLRAIISTLSVRSVFYLVLGSKFNLIWLK